jgi:hypothetical protein
MRSNMIVRACRVFERGGLFVARLAGDSAEISESQNVPVRRRRDLPAAA